MAEVRRRTTEYLKIITGKESKMGIPKNNRYSGIGIFDLFDDGEELWFTSIEYNALFKMNKQTSEIEYAGSFPDEEWNVYRLYTSINEWEGKLLFTPCAACEIGIYDKIKKQFKKVNIGLSKQDNDISKIKYGKKFVSGFIYNHTLILIPCCYDKTVFYDINNDKINVSDELYKYFYAKYNSFATSLDSQFYFCWYAKRINHSEIIFDLHCNQNIVVIYNLVTGKFRERKAGDKNRSFSLIEYYDKSVYLYDEMADVLVRWELYTDEVIEYYIADILPEFQACGLNHSFVNMIILENWLYLIPANTNMAVKINITTMDMFIEDILSKECSVRSNEIAYLGLCRVFEDKMYLFRNRSKKIIIYEKGRILQAVKTELSSWSKHCIQKNYIINLINNQIYLFGEDVFLLNDFLDAVISLKSEKYREKIANTTGSRIYEYINNIC